MNGKVNKRVDGLLHILMKYEIHTFFNRQTKELMWKYNKKVARERERHQQRMKIDHSDFQVKYVNIMANFNDLLNRIKTFTPGLSDIHWTYLCCRYLILTGSAFHKATGLSAIK